MTEDFTPNSLSNEFVSQIGYNEVNLNDQLSGFLASDPEPETFMSIEKTTSKTAFVTDPRLILTDVDYTLFEFRLRIRRSNLLTIYTRHAYTALDVLGDFGGFNDAMFLIFGFFMFYYNEMRYNVSTSHEFVLGKGIKNEQITELAKLSKTLTDEKNIKLS